MTTKQEALEQALGTPTSGVNWRKRMKEGVLVTLKIKRWRARQKLTLSELGIYPPTNEARDAYEQLLTLGSKILLPVPILKELDAIERGARLHLGEYAFRTPFGNFVPFSTYGMWKAGNEDYKERFFAKRDEIRDQYDDLVEQLLAEYAQIARHSYGLLSGQVNDFTEAFPTEEAFLTHFREDFLLRNIKPVEEVVASFVYDEELARIPLVGSVGTEAVTDEEVEETILAKQVEIEAAQRRSRQLEEMNRDLIQKTRAQKEELIDNFLTSLVSQIRTLTYDAVTSVLASIKDQETLQGRPVIQLQKLIEQIKNLNFYGDQDIDAILTLLHSIIVKTPKERNVAEITRQLRSIATVTRGTILALGETPREGRDVSPQDIGVPIEPTDEEIREAREEITTAVQTAQFPEGLREEREEREEQEAVATVATKYEEVAAERTE